MVYASKMKVITIIQALLLVISASDSVANECPSGMKNNGICGKSSMNLSLNLLMSYDIIFTVVRCMLRVL